MKSAAFIAGSLLLGAGFARPLLSEPPRAHPGPGPAAPCRIGRLTNIPAERQALFADGSRLAVAVVYSQKFEDSLAYCIAHLSAAQRLDSAWQPVEAHQTAQRLRERICGLNITTFGGLQGRWYLLWYGTLAFDGEGGDVDAPIRFNRLGLDHRNADASNPLRPPRSGGEPSPRNFLT